MSEEICKREHFAAIMQKRASKSGFWHGHPHKDSLPAYLRYFDAKDDDELSILLGDTFTWIPDGASVYRAKDGKQAFDIKKDDKKPSDIVSDNTEDIWPDASLLDFDAFSNKCAWAKRRQLAVLSGMWAPFYHIVADLFGMEEYFVKMNTEPATVHYVTERVVRYFQQANELFFSRFANGVDAYFFGNDFGTQLDLMISPEQFRTFVLPYQKRLIDQAKEYGLFAVLHSCGAVRRVIPDLIDAGVDALHPIQTKAKGMEPEFLKKEYGKDLVFIGGVDTQELLVFGTPEQIYEKVLYLRDLFGPNYIVSPSHEALLPNVPAEHVEAMVRAAHA